MRAGAAQDERRLTSKNKKNKVHRIQPNTRRSSTMPSSTETTVAQDVRERIYQTADALYEEAGRERYPTVDAVRKASKANMNDASSVMRQWRHERKSEVAPVISPVPGTVQSAFAAAAASIWAKAQEVANEGLQAAQSAWEAERAELEAMRQEMADAFESQASELQAAQQQLEAQGQALAQAQEQAAATQSAASTARAMLEEMNLRHGQLLTTLAQTQEKAERAIADAARLQGRLDALDQGN